MSADPDDIVHGGRRHDPQGRRMMRVRPYDAALEAGEAKDASGVRDGDWLESVVLLTDAGAPLADVLEGLPGGPVTLYADSYATGDGVTDDGPGLQSALDAIGTYGTLEFSHGKTYYLGSGGSLKIAANATKVRIKLNGATIKLSGSCPSAFTFTKNADYDFFRNLEILDGRFDANAVTTGNYRGVILDPGSAATNFTRVNWDEILIRNCVAYNLPAGSTSPVPAALPHRRGVYISCAQESVGHDSTECQITNVILEDVEIYGGNTGVFICGENTGAGSGDKNVFHDNIVLRRVKHFTLANYNGVAQVYSANFQVGSRGYGDRLIIDDCHGHESGDVGLEINALLNVHVSNTTIRNAAQVAVLMRNYNTTWMTDARIDEQTITFTNCTGRLTAACAPSEANQATNPFGGWSMGGAGVSRLGTVRFRNCKWIVDLASTMRGKANAISATSAGAPRELDVNGFLAVYKQLDSAVTGTVSPKVCLQLGMSQTEDSVLRLRNVRIKARGTANTANTVNPRWVTIDGSSVDLLIDGMTIDHTLTGQTGATDGVHIGDGVAASVRGSVRALRVVLGSGSGGNGLSVEGGTVLAEMMVRDSDLSGVGAANAEWFVNTTNKATVTFVNVKRKSVLGLSTLTTPASNTATQVTTGYPIEQWVYGGTVSLIEVSRDGTTWVTLATSPPAADVTPMMLENGDWFRITYSASPTVRRLPRLT